MSGAPAHSLAQVPQQYQVASSLLGVVCKPSVSMRCPRPNVANHSQCFSTLVNSIQNATRKDPKVLLYTHMDCTVLSV